MTVAVALGGCVDDYSDANPALRLDAPYLRITTPAGANNVLVTNAINAFQSEAEVFLTYEEPLVVTVTVVDAPGKIGDISVTSSIPEYGTVVLDEASVNAVKGRESGDFTFIFTPNPELEDESDRGFNIEVKVSDNQLDKNGSSSPKTTTLTVPVTLGKCVSQSISTGFYLVTEVTAFEDGGDDITVESIQDNLGGRPVVEIKQVRPGLYSISDVTGGVWPAYYPTRAQPTVQVDLCGNTITGQEGGVTVAPRTYTVDGTANEDGTVTIEWSYVRDDGLTPEDPAHGTFTMTPISAL